MWVLNLVLLVLLGLLQHSLWWGDGGLRSLEALNAQIEAQRDQNRVLSERNRGLAAEVRDLKTGLEAIEERARLELGMIRHGETFYLFVEP